MNTDKIRERLRAVYVEGRENGHNKNFGVYDSVIDVALAAITSELEKDGATAAVEKYRPEGYSDDDEIVLADRNSVFIYVADMLDGQADDAESFALARAFCQHWSDLEKSAPRWVSVEERLPEASGTYVTEDDGILQTLGFLREGDRVGWNISENWISLDRDHEMFPSYWLENLPTHPAKKEEHDVDRQTN